MAVYAIYKYSFRRGENNLANADINPDAAFDQAQDLFEAMFPNSGSFDVYHTADSGEVTVYHADVQKTWQHVIVLHFQKERDRVLHTREYGISHQPDFPYCKIIIDNRPNVAQIAIEKSSAFSGKPSKVFDILYPFLRTKLLDECHLDFLMKIKYKAGDFWDIINERRTRFKDRVKSVQFDFDNPRVRRPADTTADMASMMIATASATNADSASFLLKANSENELEVSRNNANMANLVELCANNSYTISVNFQTLGVYNYGSQARAMVIMSDPKIIDEFLSQQLNLLDEYRLISWLDNVRNQTADFVTDEDE